jgi:hypothetical protein
LTASIAASNSPSRPPRSPDPSHPPPSIDALRRIDQRLDAVVTLDPLLTLDDVALVLRKFALLFQLRDPAPEAIGKMALPDMIAVGGNLPFATAELIPLAVQPFGPLRTGSVYWERSPAAI